MTRDEPSRKASLSVFILALLIALVVSVMTMVEVKAHKLMLSSGLEVLEMQHED